MIIFTLFNFVLLVESPMVSAFESLSNLQRDKKNCYDSYKKIHLHFVKCIYRVSFMVWKALMNFNEHCDISTSKTISTLHSTGIFRIFCMHCCPTNKNVLDYLFFAVNQSQMYSHSIFCELQRRLATEPSFSLGE